MTSYSRLEEERPWEKAFPERAMALSNTYRYFNKSFSNGASDFGNKFGQPLICGSVLTFEHNEQENLQTKRKLVMIK